MLENFSDEVRFQRSKAGLSQQALAEMLKELGVSIDQTGIARIESGKREPRLSEALAIGQLLHISLDDHFSGYGRYARYMGREVVIQSQIRRCIEALRGLSLELLQAWPVVGSTDPMNVEDGNTSNPRAELEATITQLFELDGDPSTTGQPGELTPELKEFQRRLVGQIVQKVFRG